MSIKVIMHQTRVTKNTVRYDEPGEGRTLRNIYVDKEVVRQLAPAVAGGGEFPLSLSITLEAIK